MTTTPEHAGAVERPRSHLARVALAAWVNVRPEQLPADKMWVEHPNDENRQAWERVVAAILAEGCAALSRADARVLELVGALEPFARAFLQYGVSPTVPDHLDLVMGVTLGDFRAAAAALAALNATSPGMGSGDEKASVAQSASEGLRPFASDSHCKSKGDS